MTEFKHECRDCATGAYPCLGSSCTQGVTHYYCDACGEERTLYRYRDKELCADCLVDMFPVVDGSEGL